MEGLGPRGNGHVLRRPPLEEALGGSTCGRANEHRGPPGDRLEGGGDADYLAYRPVMGAGTAPDQADYRWAGLDCGSH